MGSKFINANLLGGEFFLWFLTFLRPDKHVLHLWFHFLDGNTVTNMLLTNSV